VKHETIEIDRLFYALVDLGISVGAHPVTHIVPSAIVARVLVADHAAWLAKPGLRGRAHVDNPVRNLPQGEWLDPYRSAWHLLGLETRDVYIKERAALRDQGAAEFKGRNVL
jgi:hypothetical protein